ncbi:helix-turn-helix transcriptional regulator [Fictibacillus gelatini]|uniref:helix-turn-helix transcriptional regulator n=1 Tax=Fictibacillus gelatini TaxID=225985 RepID=UPI0012B64D4E|nr:helix-turn-helix transcriptional regulator [Fictibacillus gelatini]
MFSFKKRTKLGRFLDRNGLTQEELVKQSRVSRNTVSKLCSDEEYTPNVSTMRKILNAIRKIDPSIKSDDFWDM